MEAQQAEIYGSSVLLGFYFTYRSYKCYIPYFFDCMVRIKMQIVDFPQNLIFHLIDLEILEFTVQAFENQKKFFLRLLKNKFASNHVSVIISSDGLKQKTLIPPFVICFPIISQSQTVPRHGRHHSKFGGPKMCKCWCCP